MPTETLVPLVSHAASRFAFSQCFWDGVFLFVKVETTFPVSVSQRHRLLSKEP